VSDVSAKREPAFETESEAYALFQRGVAFLRAKHPGAAALLFTRALRLEPERNSIREALGRAEFALGRHDQAAARFAAIVDDVPDSDYAHYALGRCLQKLGRDAEARGHLRLARALIPHSDLYRRTVEDLS
jgi:tetratricopeptide (TPR) repeat protein